MIILAKYATADVLTFPMLKAGTQDFAVAADWTPALGDVTFSLDGSGVGNAANLPVNVGGTGAALWTLTCSVDELTGKQCVYQIVDPPTKAVVDNALIVRTYGHANAYYPFDLGTALTPVSIADVVNAPTNANYHSHGSPARPDQLQWAIYSLLTNMIKEGTLMTVRNQDGGLAFTLTLDDPTNPASIARNP